MDSISLPSGDLTNALASASLLAQSVGETVSSNAGWLILISTACLVVVILRFIMQRTARLGQDDIPISMLTAGQKSENTYASGKSLSAYESDRTLRQWVDAKEDELARVEREIEGARRVRRFMKGNYNKSDPNAYPF